MAIPDDTPLFEVTVQAANAAARALTTIANVKAQLGITDSSSDDLLTSMVNRASALMVEECDLAIDAAKPPTFGSETCRATWDASTCYRTGELRLPWRIPVTSITSVVEGGVTLATTDYRLKGRNVLQRLSSEAPTDWSTAKIVVVYVAGWALPTSVPFDLEQACIAQVAAFYQGRERDPALKSEAVPDVYSASFVVAGGDIQSGVLLPSVEAALDSYRNPTV